MSKKKGKKQTQLRSICKQPPSYKPHDTTLCSYLRKVDPRGPRTAPPPENKHAAVTRKFSAIAIAPFDRNGIPMADGRVLNIYFFLPRIFDCFLVLLFYFFFLVVN